MSRFAQSIKKGFPDPASNTLIIAAILPIALFHASKWLVDATELDIPVIAGTVSERSVWITLIAAAAFHAGKEGRSQGTAAGWTAAVAAAYALLAQHALNSQAGGGWAEAMAHLAASAAAAMGYVAGRAYTAAMRAGSLLAFFPSIAAAGVAAALAVAPTWNLAARHDMEAGKISAASNRLLAEFRTISDGRAPSSARAHWEAVNRFTAAVLESPFSGDAFVMHRYMDYASFERRQQAIRACHADRPGDKSCLGMAEDIGGEAYQRPAGQARFLTTAIRIALGRA